MQQKRVSAPKWPRGVYWGVGTRGGRASAFAIDSRGEEIHREYLKNDSWRHAEQVIAFLWLLLDQRDPLPKIAQPKLELVKPVLPDPAQPPRDDDDPYAAQGVPGRLRSPW
jgi:hypothetical protein